MKPDYDFFHFPFHKLNANRKLFIMAKDGECYRCRECGHNIFFKIYVEDYWVFGRCAKCSQLHVLGRRSSDRLFIKYVHKG